jgi:alpha-L-fucosidase
MYPEQTSRRQFIATAALAGAATMWGSQRAAAASADQPPYTGTLDSLARHPVPQWWQDAKFGVFIHWGVYSVPAFAPTDWLATQAEWYWLWQTLPLTPYWTHHAQTYGIDVVYDQFIPQFTAQSYDPDAWADLITSAGARYFVLTTKHHEGFALFPSAASGRNAAELGPRRDLVAPLVAAARQRGLKVGLYYSVPEFFNPAPHPGVMIGRLADGLRGIGAGDLSTLTAELSDMVSFNQLPPHNSYTGLPVPYAGYTPVNDYGAFERAQLREIIAQYRPDQIWADIGGPENYFHGNDIIAEYYNQAETNNPAGVIVNDRFGDQDTHRDYATLENGGAYGGNGGYNTQQAEVVRTMGTSWGYNQFDVLSPAETFIRELAVAVANNANYVLNIGPRADGTIPQPMVDRLHTIGEWLDINGEAIYGTRPWTLPSANDVYFTSKPGQALYLIALSWPGRQLVVDAPVPVSAQTQIVLLGSNGAPLAWMSDAAGLTITMPAGGNQQAATRSQYAFAFRVTQG